VEPIVTEFLIRLFEQAPTIAALLFLVVMQQRSTGRCVDAIIELLNKREEK